MIVPFSAADFLDRALAVYAERTGIVDEPDQPATSLGDLTYARVGELARAQAAKLDELGIGVRRAGRLRLAQQRPALHRVLRGHRPRTRAGADQLPALGRRGGLHRRALRGPGPLRRPGARGRARGRGVRAQVPHRRRRGHVRRGQGPGALGARGERHRDDQLHLGHDRPAQGRADHAPQHLDQRGHLRAARRCDRPRRLPAHAADVPRQRVGDALRHDRHGRRAGGDPQDRRRRDPAPRREVRRHGDVRGSRSRRVGARGGRDLGRRDPRARQGADHRGRCTAPDEDRGSGRVRARLGVHADLRPDRDLAGADRQPHPRRVGRPRPRGAGHPAHPRRVSRPSA